MYYNFYYEEVATRLSTPKFWRLKKYEKNYVKKKFLCDIIHPQR